MSGLLCRGCGVECWEEKGLLNSFECVACNDAPNGCEQCGGTGRYTIPGCPQAYVREIGPEVNAAMLANEHGVLPVSGGSLEQSSKFLEFWTALAAELQLIRMEQSKRNA